MTEIVSAENQCSLPYYRGTLHRSPKLSSKLYNEKTGIGLRLAATSTPNWSKGKSMVELEGRDAGAGVGQASAFTETDPDWVNLAGKMFVACSAPRGRHSNRYRVRSTRSSC